MTPTVTVERTAKVWKAFKVLGVVIFLLGFPLSAESGTLGASFVLGGIVLFVVGKLGGWWQHS